MNRGDSSSCLGSSCLRMWCDVPFQTENTFCMINGRYLWLQPVEVLSATLDASGVQTLPHKPPTSGHPIPFHSRWFILFTLAKGGPQHHHDDATGLVQLRPIYLDNPHKHIQNASCCSSSSSRECSNKLSLRNSYAIQKSITSQVSRVSSIIYGNHYTR